MFHRILWKHPQFYIAETKLLQNIFNGNKTAAQNEGNTWRANSSSIWKKNCSLWLYIQPSWSEFVTKDHVSDALIEDPAYICLQDPEAVECLKGRDMFWQRYLIHVSREALTPYFHPSQTLIDGRNILVNKSQGTTSPSSLFFEPGTSHRAASTQQCGGSQTRQNQCLDTASSQNCHVACTIFSNVLKFMNPLCYCRHVLSGELSRQKFFLCNIGLFKTINQE